MARSLHTNAGIPANAYDIGYYASAAALVLTMLIGVVATKRFMRLALAPALVVGAPLAASLGTLLYVANAVTPTAALVAAGGALTGFGSALLAARWAALFGRFSLQALMANFTLLLLLIVALCLSTGYLPREAQLALLILLPLASGGCLRAAERRMRAAPRSPGQSRDNPAWPPDSRRPKLAASRLVLFVAAVAAIGATAALLGAFIDNDERFDYGGWFYLIATVLALAGADANLRRSEPRALPPLFIAPVAALVVLLLPQTNLSENFMAAVAYPIGSIAFELLLLFAAVLFARRYHASPARCFMAARLAFALSDAAGAAAGTAILEQSDALAIAYLASLLLMAGSGVLIAAVAVTVFLQRPLPVSAAPADGIGSEDEYVEAPAPVHAELTPHEAIVRRCQGLAATFGLSEREGDVLVLVAEGRSSARIQEDLSIAAGTVNYHTRNIYAKLGVHSRREVIDLVLGGGGD
ncbi:LuxR family transcriptional regulator [Adlercreutzia muris]|nr:LuxR family transcriptional regulator [Adlercreutzia muris]